MLWYGHQSGVAYLYRVAQTKRGGRLPWQVCRIRANARQQSDDWEPVGLLPCEATCAEAEEALRRYALAHGWRPGACCGCWHLSKNATSCQFFYEPVAHVDSGFVTETVRCGSCLAWGEMPPG